MSPGPEAANLTGTARLSPRKLLLGVLALIAVVYLPVVGYRFVYDDSWTLITNGFLRHPEDLWMLFTGEATARNVPDTFRPTLVVFDLLTYQLFGLSAKVHHAISIILHLAVCAVGASWLRRLGAPLTLRTGVVAIFGLLAIHAEAVAVVSFREDLLAALFGLGALCLASDGLERRPWQHGVAAGLLMALACGAKMSAAGLPLLWLIVHVSRPWHAIQASPRRLTLIALALFFGLGLALAHTLLVTGSVVPYGGAVDLRLFANRVGQGPVLAASMPIQWMYIQQMLVPLGLSPEYVDHAGSWTAPETVMATAAFILAIGYGLWCMCKRPVVACTLLGFMVLALPTANFVPMPNIRAERLMYLPSFPVCLGLAALLLGLGREVARRARAPELLWAPLAVFVVIQGSALMAACGSYRSNRQLWLTAERTAPGSARAQALVAESLLPALRSTNESEPAHANILAEIRAHCTNAERLDPHYELTHLCFARLAIAARDWRVASLRLQQALDISVDRHARILATAAEVSLDNPANAGEKRRQVAFDLLARGLREYPYSPEIQLAAAKIHHVLGDRQAALAHVVEARQLAPQRGHSVLLHLEILLDAGHFEDARKIWSSERQVIMRANPALRSALRTRLERAEQLFPSSTSTTILSPGVTTDEP